MPQNPWKKWIPGVLSENQIIKLCEKGYITNVENPKNKKGKTIDSSSIDLHLSNVCYKMKKGCVKPSGVPYEKYIIDNKLATLYKPDKNKEFKLKDKRTYIFRLREQLKDLKDSKIYGQATAKSTIGRVDVLARLIVDGMDRYEYFNSKKLEKGIVNLYIEVTPMTFPVIVNEKTSLSQLRLFYGLPENVELKGKELYETVFICKNKEDGSLSVDITKTQIDDSDKKGCAFSSIKNNNPIKLWLRKEYDPKKYWKPENPDEHERLVIKKDRFYIIRSKEKISLPLGVAVYCRATDETIGEMRIHYAGFAHPYFGMKNKGTPLIFEVRGHDMDVSLRDEEKMAILTFYRMSEDSKLKKDTYGKQTLKLSDIFKKWY